MVFRSAISSTVSSGSIRDPEAWFRSNSEWCLSTICRNGLCSLKSNAGKPARCPGYPASGVLSVFCRDYCNLQFRSLRISWLHCLRQLFGAARATASTVRRHESVGWDLVLLWRVPGVDFNWAGRQTLQIYVRAMSWMKRWESRVASATVKELSLIHI